MNEIVRFLLFFPLQLIVVFGVPYWIWRELKRSKPDGQALPVSDDGAGGHIVPLKASFVGLRGIAWIALATNNLNPSLTITSAGITFRVIRLKTRRFGDISCVDVRILGATVLLSFSFRDTPFTFDANVGNVALARSALALLPDDVIKSERARTLVAECEQSASRQCE